MSDCVIIVGNTPESGSSTTDLVVIKTELENRRFPCFLSDEEYQSIFDASLRAYNHYRPRLAFASFTTVSNQQDYKIFDPADSVTNGVCQNALGVHEVYWNPGGDWSSLNVFSPGWTMLSSVLLYTGSFFHQPSQMMMLRQKLDAWKTQFGDAGWQVFGPPGGTESFLRIQPIPQTDLNKVVVEFTKGISTIAELEQSEMYDFFNWIYYHTAEALAYKYATTAGIKLLNFSDSEAAQKFWERRMDKFYTRCIDMQAGNQGQVMRL